VVRGIMVAGLVAEKRGRKCIVLRLGWLFHDDSSKGVVAIMAHRRVYLTEPVEECGVCRVIQQVWLGIAGAFLYRKILPGWLYGGIYCLVYRFFYCPSAALQRQERESINGN
jgi:hypothetical protein